MSNKLLIYVGTTIVLVIIFYLFTKFKKKFIKDMSALLYADNNPDLFIEMMNGIQGKIFLNKKTRLFRLIDAYALKQDSANIIKIFDELESLKLNFGQEVSLYEKEVDFFVQDKMYERALIANNKVQELNAQVEIEDLNKIAVNSQSLIDIYINKDGSLALDMVKNGDEATIDTIKGTYYFRAAKCYYFKKDNKMVDKYLNKALKYLHRTSMGKVITECLADNKKLETY